MEDSSKSRQHGMPLLVHSRKITADAAKSGDPSRTAKGARNLLLHFRPAKIPLGLVVRHGCTLVGFLSFGKSVGDLVT